MNSTEPTWKDIAWNKIKLQSQKDYEAFLIGCVQAEITNGWENQNGLKNISGIIENGGYWEIYQAIKAEAKKRFGGKDET